VLDDELTLELANLTGARRYAEAALRFTGDRRTRARRRRQRSEGGNRRTMKEGTNGCRMSATNELD
jgi:hypothetical protein